MKEVVHLVECEKCEHILNTIRSFAFEPDSAKEHLDELHRGFHPPSLGVYCYKCKKDHVNCLCRTHEWIAREEKWEAPG